MKANNMILVLLLAGFLGLGFWTYTMPSSYLLALADAERQELVDVSLIRSLTSFWHDECQVVLQTVYQWLIGCGDWLNQFDSNTSKNSGNSPFHQTMMFLWALYQWGGVVVERVGQTLACLLLALPAALVGWRYAILQERIRRHDFNGELPAVMKHKKAALVVSVALMFLIQFLPVKIPMALLMVTAGVWLTMCAMFLATVRETNRS